MKRLMKISALVLALVMMVSLCACHPKDETAYTVKDGKTKASVKITSAQYLYALTNATMEAQQNINNANSGKTIKDYTKYKVKETGEDGKETETEYYKWINKRAEEQIREYAASMLKKEELDLKLDESIETNLKSYSDMYWQYYYQATFEKNGINSDTYLKMFKGSYFKNAYFLSIYDEKGSNPVDEKTVSKTFYDNYCLADTIKISVKTEDANADSSENAQEEENKLTLDQAKSLLKGYKKRIEGKEKFADIFAEYNKQYNKSDSENQQSENSAEVYASDETGNGSEYFEDVMKLKTGSIKILTSSDKSEVILVSKLNIKKSENNYLDSYHESVLHQLKDDEFEKDFKDYMNGLKLEANTTATKRLTAEDIDVSQETASEDSSTAAQ